jgi:predicted ATP-grasp superfamily ATP-dependent carboligase
MAVATPILILGVDGHSMHHGGLGIIRSAGRLGIPVFQVHEGGRPSIARSRYSHGDLTFPQAVSVEQKLEILNDFSRDHGRAVLIPVDDTSAMFVGDHASELEAGFLFPDQPSGLARALASKREMHRLCLEHDIPTPAADFPESEGDVLRHAGEAEFPVVAKIIDNSLPASAGARSVSIARDSEDLLDAYRLMRSPDGSNVMLQEYIPGGAESIWMLNGYFDAGSDCLLAFTGQKVRQSPPYTGATALGVCRANPTVEATTKRFMKALGYRGILDLGYRFDSRDGQYKLLDVNPRIGATFRLFVGADGMDVLRALYLDLTGQKVSPSAQRDGRRWIVETLDLKSSWTYIRRGDVTVTAWLRSLRHLDETAWWDRGDPLPLIAELVSLLVNQLNKRSGRRLSRRRGRPRR